MANRMNIFRRHARGLIALGALTLTSVGCATGSHAKVEDSRVASLPPGELQDVKSAQAQLQEAQQQEQSLKRSQQEADSRVTLAQKEVEIAQAELDKAKAQVDIQKKQGQAVEMDDTGKAVSLKEPQMNVDAAKAKLKYVQSLKGIASKQDDVAKAQIDLQKAKVEQAQFQALQQHDPQAVAKDKMKAGDFQAAVASRQADVAKANADLQRMRGEANQNYEAWMQLERQSSNPERRANVPPPPRGQPLP